MPIAEVAGLGVDLRDFRRIPRFQASRSEQVAINKPKVVQIENNSLLACIAALRESE
jgi:hypothetical protein